MRWCLVLFALAISACSAPLPEDLVCEALPVAERMPEISQGSVMTPEEAQIFGMGAMFQERAAEQAPRRAARARLPRVNVALLSAGGQWGAFTAGFFTGWSENRVEPRPADFDVVTGVSTGALLAPLIFAGPEYDPVLAAGYNGVRERDILRRRGVIELAGSASLWDPAPLSRLIDRQISGALLDDIAGDAGERTLLVGAVNLRTGFFEAFDLTSQAKATRNRAPCFREALLASAAIPIAFPPRRVNGALYVDGAARQGLFLRGLAEARVRPTVYVFLNNAGAFPEDEPDYALPALASRSSQILSDELLRSSAIEAIQFAKDQGWTVRGLFAPEVWPGPDCLKGDGSKLSFCESFTRELFAEGQRIGAGGKIPWLGADALIERLATQSSAREG